MCQPERLPELTVEVRNFEELVMVSCRRMLAQFDGALIMCQWWQLLLPSNAM